MRVSNIEAPTRRAVRRLLHGAIKSFATVDDDCEAIVGVKIDVSSGSVEIGVHLLLAAASS